MTEETSLAPPLSPKDLIEKAGGTRAAAKICGVDERTIRRWKQLQEIDPAFRADLERALPAKPALHLVKSGDPSAVRPSPRPSPPQKRSKRTRAKDRAGPVYVAPDPAEDARQRLQAAKAAAKGRPPEMPVKGYPVWIVLLGLLEVPALGMAFSQASALAPVWGYSLAVSVSALLMVLAHQAGWALARAHAEQAPTRLGRKIWRLCLWIGAGIVTAITVMRWDGVKTDMAGKEQAMTFSWEPLPELAQQQAGADQVLMISMVGATLCVTLCVLFLATLWSYLRHGPQAEYYRAARAYRIARDDAEDEANDE